MTDSVQEQLLGHLLDALDDDEQQVVESRLESDPQLRHQWELLRRRLEPLEVLRADFDPPAGLAERTCQLVASHGSRLGAPPPSEVPLAKAVLPSPPVESPSWASRVRWLDVAMAAAVLIAGALLTIPALQHSRFHSRLIACQENLKEIGQTMKQYAQGNGGYFPRIPPRGNLAAAGIYAPMLKERRLLTDVHRVVCPDSSLADLQRFRIPSLPELQSASPEALELLRKRMGGSYGYHLGHYCDGVYHHTKDQNRTYFALMSDAPNATIPGYQSDHHAGRGQNVLFEDGRVKFLTTSRISPDADDFFANDDGLIAAGTHPNDAVIGSSPTMPIIWVKNGH